MIAEKSRKLNQFFNIFHEFRHSFRVCVRTNRLSAPGLRLPPSSRRRWVGRGSYNRIRELSQPSERDGGRSAAAREVGKRQCSETAGRACAGGREPAAATPGSSGAASKDSWPSCHLTPDPSTDCNASRASTSRSVRHCVTWLQSFTAAHGE